MKGDRGTAAASLASLWLVLRANHLRFFLCCFRFERPFSYNSEVMRLPGVEPDSQEWEAL